MIRIKRDVIVYGMGKKEKLPNKFSKTFQFTRYEKLVLPQVTLTEGVTPTSTSITLSTVQAVMDQWGAYVDISDVADITIKHPIMEQAITLLGEQAAETIDRECIKVLLANTNVFYAGVATSRSTLGTSDYITSGLVKTLIAFLRRGGAHYNEGGRTYMGLIDPDVEMDLLEDDTFVLAASYSNIVALQNGEAGKWMATRWMVSNLLPIFANIPTAGITTASTTGGTLTNSTNYFVVVTGVDNSLGFESQVSPVITQATAGGGTAINVTVPAATGYTYNVYLGATSSTATLFSTGNAPSAVVLVTNAGTGAAPPANPNTGVNVHAAWVIGKDAFAVPELMSLQTFLTPKQASDSDPLLQRRRASWKVMFKCVICNQAFLARLECSSRYS